MRKAIITILSGLVAVAMCQDHLAESPSSHASIDSPRVDQEVFEGQTYKNASIGLELTLPPALKFGFPKLKESPVRLVALTAWDSYVREGMIFSANVLSHYPIEQRSTENRMQSLVDDLHQVGFESIEGNKESKLGAIRFVRRDFEKVGHTDQPTPNYEIVFMRACSARELMFIFYGPDRNSVKKLATETELKLDLTTFGCGLSVGDTPKQ